MTDKLRILEKVREIEDLAERSLEQIKGIPWCHSSYRAWADRWVLDACYEIKRFINNGCEYE